MRERPAVLHSYLFSANWRSLLAGRLTRVPLIISSVRNVDIHSRSAGLAFEWLLAGLTDRVIANAEAVKDHVSRRHLIPAEKIHVVYNGVALERAEGHAGGGGVPETGGATAGAGVPDRGGRVAMIASLTPKKDHGTFLEAVRLIARDAPDTRFQIVGDGGLRDELSDRVTSMGLSDVVELTGARDDIGAILSEVDVSVLTSLKEGCSNVVLESMAAARPVVVTDVGGNRELVEDGVTGYLVPVGDAAGIARRVLELLRNPDLRQSMGAEGRACALSRFTAERMADDTVAFYLSVLGVRATGLEAWVRVASERERHSSARAKGALRTDDSTRARTTSGEAPTTP
jgi:glycosyltransferase involved in cell wall biosynthesis